MAGLLVHLGALIARRFCDDLSLAALKTSSMRDRGSRRS